MKIQVIILISLLTLFTGCSTIQGLFGKNSIREAQSAAKIELAQSAISQNTSDKLAKVSELSFGTDYALRLSDVSVAKELNDRVLNIAGLPPLEEQKAMTVLVTDLISTNLSLVKEGQLALSEKDKEIISLQYQNKDLEKNKDIAIANFVTLAKSTALKTDTISSQLSSYQSYWGLGGVFLGLFSLGSHLFWALLIGFIIYMVIRTLATVYPPFGAIWAVVAQFGALLIKTIEGIFPQAISKLGLIESEVHADVVNELVALKNQIVQTAVSTSTPVVIQTPVTGSVTH